MGALGGRRRLAAVGAAALLGGTFAVAGTALAQDHGGHEGLLPEGEWSDEQIAQAAALVEEAEEALAAFADPAQLEAQGFYDFGGRAPGGWDHWIHPGWMADDVYLDPNRPESLVFRATPEGDDVLEAVMYILPEGYDMDSIPADVAWLPGWHTHDDICIDDQGRFSGTVDPDGTCDSGEPLDWPPMMHVWIADNPCGHRFAGVDVGGIECGDHNHEPPGGGPDPTHPGHEPPNDPEQPGPTHPGHHPPNDPEQPGPTHPGGHGGGGGHPHRTPAATPVQADPHYHG